MKIPWKEIEELIKREYGLKSVQLTYTDVYGRIELNIYPDYVEGEKDE